MATEVLSTHYSAPWCAPASINLLHLTFHGHQTLANIAHALSHGLNANAGKHCFDTSQDIEWGPCQELV